MQAADVFVKMTCSIVIPMASLDLANSARKRVLVQSAEAEYLLALESRLWELLPASLMVAAIVALVAEVWHPPFSLCLMVHPACFSTGLLCPNKLYMHVSQEKKRKEKTTPFGVNLMRRQVLYRAAQSM